MNETIKRFPANRTMPDCAIIPVLHYKDVPEAIEWLCRTFGCTERWRVADHRSQLAYEGGCIAITELSAGQGRDGDKGLGSRHSIMMRVKDAHAHYQHVKQQGATIIQEPIDWPYGERQYEAEDLGGHRWTFSESIADTVPENWGGVSGNLSA
ncbi:MAG: VOC family protein [Bacteroidetes bacterium]|nr:VOC family protein [Bacteroidota bacterium]